MKLLKSIILATLYFFIFASVCSFLYTFLYQEYNGDYLLSPVTISKFELTINLFFILMPYFFLLRLYSIKRKFILSHEVSSSPVKTKNFFLAIYVFLYIFHVFATLKFGFGISAVERYTAPLILKYVFGSLDRFNIYFLACYLILVFDSKKIIFFIIISMLFLTFSRASIGWIFYTVVLLAIKFVNPQKINTLKILFIAVFLVLLTFGVYELRNNVRGVLNSADSLFIMLFGVIFGRFSSFSNSASIFENFEVFSHLAINHDPLFFLKEFINSIFGRIFDIIYTVPEMVTAEIFNADPKSFSIPIGLQGVLFFSYLISPYIFLINAFLFYIIIFLVYKLITAFNFKHSHDLAVLTLLLPIMSGDIAEFGRLVLPVIFIYFINLCYGK